GARGSRTASGAKPPNAPRSGGAAARWASSRRGRWRIGRERRTAPGRDRPGRPARRRRPVRPLRRGGLRPGLPHPAGPRRRARRRPGCVHQHLARGGRFSAGPWLPAAPAPRDRAAASGRTPARDGGDGRARRPARRAGLAKRARRAVASGRRGVTAQDARAPLAGAAGGATSGDRTGLFRGPHASRDRHSAGGVGERGAGAHARRTPGLAGIAGRNSPKRGERAM
ncbi:MAG: hypothetical protein AVDCRST_MAG88-1250, partial [uncultured Thermomicrobiales bacterium]